MILIRTLRGDLKHPGERIAGKLLYLLPGILLCLFCFSLSSFAAEIESVIPAYSAAYIAVKDVSGIWDIVEKSPSWQSVLSYYWMDAAGFMEAMKELPDPDIQTLLGVFGKRIAFVQISVDPESSSSPVMIADLSNSEGASEIVGKIEQAFASDGKYEVRSQAGKYLNVPYNSIGRVGQESSIIYALLDNLLVLAVGQESFETIVDVYSGKEPSILYEPKFIITTNDVSTDGPLFAYANLEILWPVVLPRCDWELCALLQMFGIHEIKSVAYAADILNTGNQDIYMYSGDSNGLLVSMFARPKPLISPHIIPAANSDVFLSLHLGDPAAIWEIFRNSVKETLDEENYSEMQGGILGFEQKTGLSLSNDILSSLTGEIGFAMPIPDYMEPLEGPNSLLENGLTIFCGVEDREKCAMSLEKILSTSRVPLEQVDYKGISIYRILPLGNPEIPVGYMFAGDLLIFGNFSVLEEIINEEPPLVISEGFVQLISGLPEQLGLLGYMDVRKTGELLLKANPEVELADYLARLQTLSSVIGAIVYDGEGLSIRSVGIQEKGWLGTIGDLAKLLIGALFDPT